jgi:hypothetical protein
VLLVLLAVGIRGYAQSLASPDQEGAGAAWWFPVEPPASEDSAYELEWECTTIPGDGPPVTDRWLATFTLEARASNSYSGSSMRVSKPTFNAAARRAGVDTWFERIESLGYAEIELTPERLSLSRIPFLSGPWQAGDRLSVILGIPPTLSVQAEVVFASHRRLEIEYRAWWPPRFGKRSIPGTLRIVSDATGIVDGQLVASGVSTTGLQMLRVRVRQTSLHQPEGGAAARGTENAVSSVAYDARQVDYLWPEEIAGRRLRALTADTAVYALDAAAAEELRAARGRTGSISLAVSVHNWSGHRHKRRFTGGSKRGRRGMAYSQRSARPTYPLDKLDT